MAKYRRHYLDDRQRLHYKIYSRFLWFKKQRKVKDVVIFVPAHCPNCGKKQESMAGQYILEHGEEMK